MKRNLRCLLLIVSADCVAVTDFQTMVPRRTDSTGILACEGDGATGVGNLSNRENQAT
jgi:hypothetical protein